MSAELDTTASVYHCVICGPLFRFHLPHGAWVTYHNNVPHPYNLHDEPDESLQ